MVFVQLNDENVIINASKNNVFDNSVEIETIKKCEELVNQYKYENGLLTELGNKIDICDENLSPEEQLMDMAKMILDLQYQIDVLTLLNQEG